MRAPRTRHTRTLGAAVVALVASYAVGVASASATTVFWEGWESGNFDATGWTAQDTSMPVDAVNDPRWQILSNPQTISVSNPAINPNLVTLPDAGSLPTANNGTHAVWFGDTSSGTFCGMDWAYVAQTAKDGCTSREAFSGTLTSRTFSLQGVTSAALHFFSYRT